MFNMVRVWSGYVAKHQPTSTNGADQYDEADNQKNGGSRVFGNRILGAWYHLEFTSGLQIRLSRSQYTIQYKLFFIPSTVYSLRPSFSKGSRA